MKLEFSNKKILNIQICAFYYCISIRFHFFTEKHFIGEEEKIT